MSYTQRLWVFFHLSVALLSFFSFTPSDDFRRRSTGRDFRNPPSVQKKVFSCDEKEEEEALGP